MAYELSRLAMQGCAVISTCSTGAAPFFVPAATVTAELRPAREPAPKGAARKKAQAAARAIDLAIVKNRFGPTPTVPLTYKAAASVFEERQS